MSKVALIIGVSTYASGFSPLPSAIPDGEAMRDVLQSPEIGKFDDVTFISDPDPLQMQEAIEGTFSGRKKDDLVLLFFSGHGVKDSNGKLYLATALTKKTERGDLVKSTAVSASFIHDIMKDSRSKRKVVILDCCFSGAFAHGLSAKDDGTVDLKSQLGGEGCAVLTSSSSVQYSFEQQGEELSVYTRYLVEGIQTGAADLGSDGYISVDELHEYAQSKVHEESPSMNPKIYALEEGYKIQLLEAVAPDPLLKYQRAVEQCAVAGEISQVWRITLDEMRTKLQLSADEADLVETRVLRPYREYRKKLQRYEYAFKTVIQQGFPVKESVRAALKQLQRTLALRNEDILAIEEKWEKWAESKLSKPTAIPQTQKVQQPIESSPPAAGTPLPKSVQAVPEHHIKSQKVLTNMPSINTSPTNTSSAKNTSKLWIGVSVAATLVLATGAGIFALVFNRTPSAEERTLAEILFESPELIVAEECELLKDAYELEEDTIAVNALTNNPSITRVGQKCTELGVVIQPIPVIAQSQSIISEPRSIQDVLYGSVDLITSEECNTLQNAYENRNAEVIRALTSNPANTAVGIKCLELGTEIEPQAESINVNDGSENEVNNQPDSQVEQEVVEPPNETITLCIIAEGNLQLYSAPDGLRSDIGVAPGEGVTLISNQPTWANFGGNPTPFVEIRKANGYTGWIPENHTEVCP